LLAFIKDYDCSEIRKHDTNSQSNRHQHFLTLSAQEYEMPEKNNMLHSSLTQRTYTRITFCSHITLVVQDDILQHL
jgi:hypothetical protein